jgi:hypothetical protein
MMAGFARADCAAMPVHRVADHELPAHYFPFVLVVHNSGRATTGCLTWSRFAKELPAGFVETDHRRFGIVFLVDALGVSASRKNRHSGLRQQLHRLFVQPELLAVTKH